MDEFEEMLRLCALRDEIIKRYEAGERNFTGIDMHHISISYPCFMDTDFSNVNMEGSLWGVDYLVNANLSGANLEGSDLFASVINTNLTNANLRNIKFRSINLTGVNLSVSDLSGADLSGAKLIGVNLSGANLTDAKITVETIFCNTIMPDGRIENSSNKVVNVAQLLDRYAAGERDFGDIVLHACDLSGVNLQSVNLRGAHFSYVNLQGAILHGELTGRFIGCDMRDIELISSDPDYRGGSPRLICCDLRRAKCKWFDWCGGRLIGNNCQGARGIEDGSGEGFAYIHNTTWIGGTFIAGPTWGLSQW